jgi:hypothetical protein
LALDCPISYSPRVRRGRGSGIEDDRSGSDGTGSDSTEGGTTGGSTEDPGGDTQTPEEVFAHIDPQELALASAKASFVSCYMAGLVDS